MLSQHQLRPHWQGRAIALVGSIALALAAGGCGDTGSGPGASAQTRGAAPASAALTDGAWLLRFSTADGGDGELTRAVYVRYIPSTGATEVRRLPGTSAPDTYAGSQALLVSADQRYALVDAGIARADRRHGQLRVYSLTDAPNQVIDLRAWTKDPNLRPVGAAFDPATANVLRMVDSKRRVWKVDLDQQSAVRDGQLPQRSGWIFANGFDKNTGLPFIEDIDTSETLPPGNGDDDVRPVERRGGTIRSDDGIEHPDEPAMPCGFAAGFTFEDGTVWIFCADTPRISGYRLTVGGDAWEPIGKASGPVIPASAAELPVVLPPVD